MRVFLLSDSPAYTSGYANIARHFAVALQKRGHVVAFGSFQSTGLREYVYDGQRFPEYGCNPPNVRVGPAVSGFRPDVLLHVRDPVSLIPKWFPGVYSIRAQAQGIPIWGWSPVQHEGVPVEYVEAMLREYDRTLAFTAAGRERLCNAGLMRNEVDALMPGISPTYAATEGPAADLGRKGVPLFLVIGVPDPRKAFPVLMRAYRKIMGRVDADFYLHTAVRGNYDLQAHILSFGVQGHWLFPIAYTQDVGMSEEELARYYRAARAYVSVGTGEGLNMPLMEAAAMGRFVIYPDMPNNDEVVSDYDGPQRAVRSHLVPQTTAWEWLMDPEALAGALEDAAKYVRTPKDDEAGKAYYARHTWGTTVDRFLSIAAREGLT